MNQELNVHFRDQEIGHMTCLGRCHENSAFHYNGKNYSGNALDELNDIINKKTYPNPDSYIVKAHGREILSKPFSCSVSNKVP